MDDVLTSSGSGSGVAGAGENDGFGPPLSHHTQFSSAILLPYFLQPTFHHYRISYDNSIRKIGLGTKNLYGYS